MTALYEITVDDYVDEVWSDWFVGLAITHTEQGETILRGDLVYQAALHGVLIRVPDLGLTLIFVERLTANDLPPDPKVNASDEAAMNDPLELK